MRKVHLLNQPDPDAPIDREALGAEFQAGMECWMDVPLSQTHLACLALAAQRTIFQADCSDVVRAQLLQVLGWCSQHADFGIETRKLLKEQFEAFRAQTGRDSNGVQTPGPEEEGA